jgi:hypothetical protein
VNNKAAKAARVTSPTSHVVSVDSWVGSLLMPLDFFFGGRSSLSSTAQFLRVNFARISYAAPVHCYDAKHSRHQLVAAVWIQHLRLIFRWY